MDESTRPPLGDGGSGASLAPAAGGWDSSAPPLAPGTMIGGRYRVVAPLGRPGAGGQVYRCVDEGPLSRAVAVKVLRTRGVASPSGRESYELLVAETRALAGLAHPNIVPVFDAGLWEGRPFVVQELVEGADLHAALAREGPLPVEAGLSLAHQLCDALAYVHKRGLIHRDVKPSNLLIDPEQRLRLADFGLARPLVGGRFIPEAPGVGTLGYMSPEQLAGAPLDAGADVFAAACVVYELLTGQRPFVGADREQITAATLRGAPPHPVSLRPELPETLAQVLLRALGEASRRPATAAELLRDLREHARMGALVSPRVAARELERALSLGAAVLVLGEGWERTGEGSPAWGPFLLGQLGGPVGPVNSREMLARIDALRWEEGEASVVERLRQAEEEHGAAPRPERWACLPWQLVVTTRWDLGPEAALRAAGKGALTVGYGDAPASLDPDCVPVLHLFGSIDGPEGVGLDSEELQERLERLPQLPEMLLSRLATATLLYLGLEPHDDRLRAISRALALGREGLPAHGYLVTAAPCAALLSWTAERGLAVIESSGDTLLSQVEVGEGGLPSRSPDPLPEVPFKGLDSYDVEDQALFFGRDREVSRLRSRIMACPLLTLFGASGTGKTSLLRAGLIPDLARSGFDAVIARPYDAPILELIRAVQLGISPELEPPDPGDPAEVGAWLSACARQTRLLVILLDQAEELFVRHEAATRRDLAQLIRSSTERGGRRIRWVLSIRDDFFPRLAELGEVLPSVFTRALRLDPLTPDVGREVLLGPAAALGYELEEELVTLLLSELGRDHVDAPQLQLVCGTLFEALPAGSRRLTAALLRAQGGVRGILTGYLEQCLSRLPSEQAAAARGLLLCLTTGEGTRAVCRPEELAQAARLTPERTSRLLQSLVAERVVRVSQREDGARCELSHDCLVAEIEGWRDEATRAQRQVRQMLDQGLRMWRVYGLTLPQAQLALVERQGRAASLTEDDHALLTASRQVVWAARVRLARGALVGAVLLVVLAIGLRFATLTDTWFLAAHPLDLVSVSWGGAESYTVVPITVMRGAPGAPSGAGLTRMPLDTLDGWLGFPRPTWETDWDAADLQDARAAGGAGQLLLAGDDVAGVPRALLTPAARVEESILAGDRPGALSLATALLRDPSTPASVLERVVPLVAVSLPPDRALVEVALEAMARQHLAKGTLENPLDTDVPPLAAYHLLLAAAPRAWWEQTLTRWLEQGALRMLALELLVALGEREDAAALVRWTEGEREALLAWRALRWSDGCGALPAARGFLSRPGPLSADATAEVLELVAACGGRQDAALLAAAAPSLAVNEQLVRALVRATLRLDPNKAPGRVRSLIRGGVAPEVVARAVARVLPPDRPWPWLGEVLEGLEQPDARAALAAALVRRGAPYAGALWEAIQQQVSLNAYAQLGALSCVRSAPLRDALLRAWEEGGLDPFQRAGVVQALAPYPDEEVAPLLMAALADPDREVATTAQRQLTARVAQPAGGALLEELLSLGALPGPPLTLRVELIAQHATGRYDPAPFLEALEGGGAAHLAQQGARSVDYAAHLLAVEGGIRALGHRPLAELLARVSSPRRATRQVAVLALLRRADREQARAALVGMATSPDAPTRSGARRALWALGVQQLMDEWTARVSHLQNTGLTQQADRLSGLIFSGRVSIHSVLMWGLDLRAEELDPHFDPVLLLAAQRLITVGELDWAVNRQEIVMSRLPDRTDEGVRALPELDGARGYLRYEILRRRAEPVEVDLTGIAP